MAQGLIAKALAAVRGERVVFAGLGFALAPGGALVLTGPNGAGKSTLLRVLAGLCPPADGQVLWQGENALADLPTHAGRVAYLGHLDAVKPGLTTAENLRFWGAAAAVRTALTQLDLLKLADLPARLLSAGQRRRLALARLVLSAAPIWLLDEPTLGLDDASVALLGGLLAGHRDRGGLVVAATHLKLPLPCATTLPMTA